MITQVSSTTVRALSRSCFGTNFHSFSHGVPYSTMNERAKTAMLTPIHVTSAIFHLGSTGCDVAPGRTNQLSRPVCSS